MWVFGLLLGCENGETCEENCDSAAPSSLSGQQAGDEQLRINELMADNANTIADETGAFVDWIEIYNGSEQEIDLAGYLISDNLDIPAKHPLGVGLLVPAKGYLLLWADARPELGPQHLNFQLSASGEELGLFRVDGTTLQALEYGEQLTDWSAAREEDGADTWIIASEPTPGATNLSP